MIATVLIRPLSTQDLALFRQLRLHALTCDPDAFGRTYALESAWPEARWSESLSKATQGDQSVFMAFNHTRSAGMCGAFITDADRSVGMIWGMFVDPAVRGSGVAAGLLDAAERFLRQRGASTAIGNVADSNARALSFYRRQGYVFGPAGKPLREGSSILVHPMEKVLGPPV